MKQHDVTFEDLVAYAGGELTGREASVVEAYLAVLPEAARTTRRLQEVIQRLRADASVPATADAVRRALGLLESLDEVPTPDWLAPVRVFAKLVFDSRAQLALAGYRGGAAGYQLAYESEHTRLDLQILPQEQPAGDTWRLRGQVTVRDDAELGGVTLLEGREDTAVACVAPDDSGRFKIDTTAGVFNLRIDLDEGTHSVIAPNLEVGSASA